MYESTVKIKPPKTLGWDVDNVYMLSAAGEGLEVYWEMAWRGSVSRSILSAARSSVGRSLPRSRPPSIAAPRLPRRRPAFAPARCLLHSSSSKVKLEIVFLLGYPFACLLGSLFLVYWLMGGGRNCFDFRLSCFFFFWVFFCICQWRWMIV